MPAPKPRAGTKRHREGAMTAHDRERYRVQRDHGRVVRVRNVLCWDCIRVALLRLPENAHNVYNHTHMTLMRPNAAASALAARAKRQVITTAKALADLVTGSSGSTGSSGDLRGAGEGAKGEP